MDFDLDIKEEIKTVTFCPWCGKEVHRVQAGTVVFCSLECYDAQVCEMVRVYDA